MPPSFTSGCRTIVHACSDSCLRVFRISRRTVPLEFYNSCLQVLQVVVELFSMSSAAHTSEFYIWLDNYSPWVLQIMHPSSAIRCMAIPQRGLQLMHPSSPIRCNTIFLEFYNSCLRVLQLAVELFSYSSTTHASEFYSWLYNYSQWVLQLMPPSFAMSCIIIFRQLYNSWIRVPQPVVELLFVSSTTHASEFYS